MLLGEHSVHMGKLVSALKEVPSVESKVLAVDTHSSRNVQRVNPVLRLSSEVSDSVGISHVSFQLCVCAGCECVFEAASRLR